MTFWLIVFSTILSTLFGYLRYKYNYWELQGVKQLPTHFLYGNWFRLKTMNHQEWLHELYATFKGKAKIAGFYIFLRPVAVVLDLDLVKTILIKDFNNFVDRFEYSNEEDPLSGHLFSAKGEHWRVMRTKLTPTFTSGKMKSMFSIMTEVAEEFRESFADFLEKSEDKSVEIHDMSGRFTTDVIGACVFGLKCNSLKDPKTSFRQIGRKIFNQNAKNIRWNLFKRTYANVLKYLGKKRFPQDIEDFFIKLIKDTVTLREKENIQRNDFINTLMELKNSKDSQGLTVEEMAAQAFVFFAAGFETSSSNMSYCLFELSKHPEIQEKLRAEILHVLAKHNNNLSYEAMAEMTYLNQVFYETLRKYPALAFLNRFVKEDYQVPGTSITLEKGIDVMIPVRAIHYDPDIYDNPKEFRPERFSHEEEQKRHPQSFLGFGDGPRNCIGLRFGRMQVRIGLITLLTSFKFTTCAKTPEEIQHSKYNFVSIPSEGVWLKAEKL